MSNREVIVYSAHPSMCGACKSAEDFLRARRVAFTTKDIAADPEALEEMMAVTGGSLLVPIVRIGDAFVQAGDTDSIARILESVE